jgi:hypothetical protein
MPTQRKKVPFLKIEIKNNYKEFKDFYDDNKEVIYKSIIEVFEGLKYTRKKTLSLLIVSEISGLEWDTEFTFSKSESKILCKDVMPYFEQIEDYETCSKILKLHSDLTN